MKRNEKREHGAALAEFALSFVVLIILVLALVDFGRFLGLRVVALKAAQDGLEFAQKIPGLDIDYRVACATTGGSTQLEPTSSAIPDECSRFNYARQQVAHAQNVSRAQHSTPPTKRSLAVNISLPLLFRIRVPKTGWQALPKYSH